MNYVLPEALGTSLLSYLMSKPYIEVANLVTSLKSLQEVTLVPTEPLVGTSPSQEGVDESVQSESSESKTEAPTQQEVGQESNGQETQPS